MGVDVCSGVGLPHQLVIALIQRNRPPITKSWRSSLKSQMYAYITLPLSLSVSLSPSPPVFLSFFPSLLASSSLPAFFFLSFTCHTICIYIFTCIILHASNGFTGEILQSSNMPGTGHDGTSCSGIAPDPIFCCYHGSQDDRNATQNTQPLLTKSQMETVPFSHLYQYMNYPVCQREA